MSLTLALSLTLTRRTRGVTRMARYDDKRDSVFLFVWTLSALATAALFLFYLAMRVRTVELGYELGHRHQELSRLREIERVLSLELSAHENPERIELVAQTLFGMGRPDGDRVRRISLRPAKNGAPVASNSGGEP